MSNGSTGLVALGANPERIVVYALEDSVLHETPMTFPNILHMIPYAKVTSRTTYDAPSVMEVAARYGQIVEMPKEQHNAFWEDILAQEAE